MRDGLPGSDGLLWESPGDWSKRADLSLSSFLWHPHDPLGAVLPGDTGLTPVSLLLTSDACSCWRQFEGSLTIPPGYQAPLSASSLFKAPGM